MKKLLYLLFSLLLFIKLSSAQQHNTIHKDNIEYTPFKSYGKIPADFILDFETKLGDDIQKINVEDKRKVKKLQEQFYTQSNYFINEILQSGDVLFGGPTLDYINKVMDVVLADDPQLRSEIRIYLLKTSEVNATTTDNGIIFINIGLLARLENEAQLAYILSHEVIHYRNKHVVDAFLEQDKIENEEELYEKASSFEQKLFAYSNYSKELELESDKLGLKDYFSNTDYSITAIDETFDILMYSYLPFENTVFDKSYFESETYKFPKKYFLKEVAEISIGEEYDDTLSTHPNIKKRKENLLEEVKNYNNDGKKDFIVSEEEFRTIKLNAQIESINLYSKDLYYVDVIYNTYLLRKKYPDSKLLKTYSANALLLTAIFKNNGEYDNINPTYYKIEAEQQQLYHLLEKMPKKELTILALREIWKLYKEYPNDQYIKEIKDKAFTELIDENSLSPEDFEIEIPADYYTTIVDTQTIKPDTISDIEIPKTDSTGKELSRYELIKLKKNRNKKTLEDDDESNDEDDYSFVRKANNEDVENKNNEDETYSTYYKYAFIDFISDSLFFEEFENLYNEDRNKNPEDDYEISFTDKYRNIGLGINKILLLPPRYLRVSPLYSTTEIKYVKTLEKTSELHDIIEHTSELAGLDCTLLSPLKLNEDDVDVVNDIKLISEWVAERMAYGDSTIPNTNSIAMGNIIDKYGSKYVGWNGLITIGPGVFGGYNSLYFFFLYDLESNEIKMFEFYVIGKGDSKDYVKSRLYNTFLQIKQ